MARDVQWQIVIWLQGFFSVLCLLVLGMVWFNIHVLEFTFISKQIARFTLFGMICFTVSSIGKCYHETIYEWKDENTANFWVSSVIYSLSWCLGQIFGYLLFIQRLIYSFKGTNYESPAKYYYPFYVGIFVFGITNLIFYIFYILAVLHILDRHVESHVYDARDIIETIVDFMVSISLLYIFLQKLWKLNSDLYIFDNNTRNAYLLNDKQQSVMKIASKLTVISSVAIISTQAYLLLKTIIFSVCKNNIQCKDYDSKYVSPVTATLWTIDCFVNTLCIFISSELVMAETMYNKLCYCCDVQCNKCCKSIVQRREKKHINNATDLQISLLHDSQL